MHERRDTRLAYELASSYRSGLHRNARDGGIEPFRGSFSCSQLRTLLLGSGMKHEGIIPNTNHYGVDHDGEVAE